MVLEESARSYAVEFPSGRDQFYILAHGRDNPPSFGKLINHSTRHPNCRVYRKSYKFSQRRCQQTKTIDVVIVETLRVIKYGEELLWDYGKKYAREKWFDNCHCRKCAAGGVYSACIVPNRAAEYPWELAIKRIQ